MLKQTSTGLYVALGCAACVVGIVIGVRAISPEEVWGSTEARAKLPFSESLSVGTDAARDDIRDKVRDRSRGSDFQIEEIDVRGKRGMLVKYATPEIDDNTMQDVSRKVLARLGREAEARGIEVIVVMAVGAAAAGAIAGELDQHIVIYERVAGQWKQVSDPGSLPVPGGFDGSSTGKGEGLLIEH